MADAKLATRIRREQIAEAALALVASEGLRRLSIAAVARQVGLVPSGIYRHFKSKDALIDAVLERMESRLAANVRAACEESDDALGRLHGVFLRHLDFIRLGRAMPRIVFADDAGSDRPARRRRLAAILGRYRGLLIELIVAGQAAGQISATVDAETASMLFLGLVVPAGIVWHISDGRFDVACHAEHVWPMYCRALGACPRRRARRAKP